MLIPCPAKAPPAPQAGSNRCPDCVTETNEDGEAKQLLVREAAKVWEGTSE